jgi:hypothetical protein
MKTAIDYLNIVFTESYSNPITHPYSIQKLKSVKSLPASKIENPQKLKIKKH